MAKEAPEQIAARIAAQIKTGQRDAALSTVDWAFGRAMFDWLARHDTAARADLIAHFEARSTAADLHEMERVQMAEITRRLRQSEG